jgi:hypothetical protein
MPKMRAQPGGVNEGDAGQLDDEPTGQSHLGQGLAELAYGEGLDLPLPLADNDIVSTGFSTYGEHFGAPFLPDGVGGARRVGGLHGPQGLGG